MNKEKLEQNIKIMSPKQANDILIKELKSYGAIEWHASKFNSHYIKFKDTRLGSIRIGDHKGRDRYSYTYEIFTDTMSDFQIEEKFKSIKGSIVMKSNLIEDFDPKRFIVYSVSSGSYVEAKNFNQYKNHILKVKLL